MSFVFREATLDSYFDKILYINLDKDQLRNESLLRQFEENNITNFERVSGVVISGIPDRSKYRNFNKTDKKYVLGSLSCRASHVQCIRLAKQRNYTRVLIFEDDVFFLQNPNKLLQSNLHQLDHWHLLYFGGLIEPHFRSQIVCAHAYAVSYELFDDILEMAETSGMEIDNFYAKIIQHMSFNKAVFGRYNTRLIQPFNQIIQDKSFLSNIQNIQ